MRNSSCRRLRHKPRNKRLAPLEIREIEGLESPHAQAQGFASENPVRRLHEIISADPPRQKDVLGHMPQTGKPRKILRSSRLRATARQAVGKTHAILSRETLKTHDLQRDNF